MSDSGSEYRIVANPSHQFVTAGTRVTYEVLPATGMSPLDSCEFIWWVQNDPKSRSTSLLFGPMPFPIIHGPAGKGVSRWENASWNFPGQHVVACRVKHSGGTSDLVFPQPVVSLESELILGPILPRHEQDALAHFDGVKRTLTMLLDLERMAPTVDAKQEQAKKELEAWKSQAERLTFLLSDVAEKHCPTYAVVAEHLDSGKGERTALRILATPVDGRWFIIDWTEPRDPVLSDRYPTGSTLDSLRFSKTLDGAMEAWKSGNRYPEGGVTYGCDIPGYAAVAARSFLTTGSSFMDSATNVLVTAGMIAGIVALALAPTGASQVAAIALASCILTGTGAGLSMYDRHERGITDVRADVLDGLTIVSCVLGGVAGSALSKFKVGGRVILALQGGAIARIIYADLAVSAVQTLIVVESEVERLLKMANDPTRTPQERLIEMLKIVATATASAALLYVNYRVSSSQLTELARSPASKSPTPEERVAQLSTPSASPLDATQEPTVNGSTRTGEHETRAQVDEDAPNRKVKSPALVVEETVQVRLQRAMGKTNFEARKATIASVRANAPDLTASLTDEEIICLRGYTSNKFNDELSTKIFDYERINNALRSGNKVELATLSEYIVQLESALSKLPAYEGEVFRIIKRIAPEDVRAQFLPGRIWSDPGFASTSFGTPLDDCRVVLFMSNTKSGRVISQLSEIASEREVLFPPGVRFKVKDTFEPNGFMYIFLEEL